MFTVPNKNKKKNSKNKKQEKKLNLMMEQIFDYRLSIFFSNSLKTNIFYNFFSFLYFQVLIITKITRKNKKNQIK